MHTSCSTGCNTTGDCHMYSQRRQRVPFKSNAAPNFMVQKHSLVLVFLTSIFPFSPSYPDADFVMRSQVRIPFVDSSKLCLCFNNSVKWNRAPPLLRQPNLHAALPLSAFIWKFSLLFQIVLPFTAISEKHVRAHLSAELFTWPLLPRRHY